MDSASFPLPFFGSYNMIFRGNVHAQTATLNVKLTFVGLWVKMSDVRVVAEMSKTNFQNTTCIIINRQNKNYLVPGPSTPGVPGVPWHPHLFAK